MRLFVPQSDSYKHVIGNVVKHLFHVILNILVSCLLDLFIDSSPSYLGSE